jgi:glycosyltransferase involved in cell wall biosynthesis
MASSRRPAPRQHHRSTRDKLELLRPCVESVLARTDYRNVELLIVDNDSSEASTAAYLCELTKRSNVRVLPYAGANNFSAINNFAVGEAGGAYVCLSTTIPKWSSPPGSAK